MHCQKTTCPVTVNGRNHVASDSKIRRSAQLSDNDAGRLVCQRYGLTVVATLIGLLFCTPRARCVLLSDAKLVDLFKKQMTLERSTAKNVQRLAARTRNSIPKLLLKGIELDSTKHAHMYATLIDLSSGATVSKMERYDMKKELEQHVENERIMLLQAQRIARSLKDPRMKPLLQSILADERRHHKALSTLLKAIAVEEKISQDDWWGFLNKWAVFST